MLRITRADGDDGNIILKLEGRFVGPQGSITLEATQVGFASEAGLSLLRELHDRQVARLTCSSFLHHLIADYCELPQRTQD